MSNLQTKTADVKTVATAKANEKPAQNGTATKKEIKDILQTSAEQRIKKAENFGLLAKKHLFLKSKLDELSAFLVGRDGLKEKLILENPEGRDFEISNSAIIHKILMLCEAELLEMTEKSEKEILNFTI